MKVGDFVRRKKYQCDVLFQIVAIVGSTYYLKGVEYRLLADANEDDLVLSQFEPMREDVLIDLDTSVLKGKILHIDGDDTYLKMCEDKYKDLGVRAICVHLRENEMEKQIVSLLEKHQPELLVITGHDALNEKKEYSHSNDFIQCVRKARQYQPDKDRLIIFAGACQSDYERLIAAGANFASSPKRVNIHALDPVYLMSQVAVVSVRDYIDIEAITNKTTCKLDGIGGIDTKGVARRIYPRKEPL